MKLIHPIDELRALLAAQSGAAGFVPTMGSLHAGHLSLIERSTVENQFTVVSVFVNPPQFGPGEDFKGYPRDLKRDVELAHGTGASCVFAPSEQEMYPHGYGEIAVQVGRLGEVGEGRFRPGHFAAVATVCAKLFNIVGPCRAYFGEKDAQQLAVIRRMVGDLDFPVEVISCPTVREPDGLAMSSRNARLTSPQRRAAPALFKALSGAAELAASGVSSAPRLVQSVVDGLSVEPLVRLQYSQVVDPSTFEPLQEVKGAALMTAAAFLGEVRLIDSVPISAPKSPADH